MRKTTALILLLLLSSIVYAEEDLTLKDELLVNLEISSSIGVDMYSSNSYLNNVKVELNYHPKDSYRQDVRSLEAFPNAKIDDMIIFEWENPKTYPLTFSLNSRIETKSDFVKVKKKISFPIHEYPLDVYEYTKHSPMIDTNEKIRELAAKMAQGEDDLYVVVFKLAEWTRENIEYDLSSVAAEAVKPSSWVLQNREGVCDELTNLFISLARSLGIPARFVTGFSYTNNPEFPQPWGAHGWAEVYFPDYGWVPFDPTYGEFGYIDAGHIKLKDSLDSNRTSTSYEWLGKNVDLMPQKLDISVKVLDVGRKIDHMVDVGLQILNEKVGFGSYNLIEAQIKNEHSYYVTTIVYLTLPEELELLDDYEKPLILKPWEKKSVFWRVQIPKELNNNYVYTFPAILTTQRNQTIKADFSSESGWTQLNLDMLDEIIEENDIGKGTDALSFFCITEKNEVKLNEKMIFTCKLANNQRMVLSGLNVCLENDCKLTSLNPGEEKELFFEKSFDKESGNIVVITAKNDEISKAYYTSIMVLDTPKLKIENMNFPKFVNYNDEFAVNFTIFKSSYSPPKNVVLTLHQNKNIESWQIENMDGSLPFAINLEGRYLKLGRNEMEVLLNYEDADGNKYVSEETFTVYLQTKSFWEKVMIYINQAALFLERIIFY